MKKERIRFIIYLIILLAIISAAISIYLTNAHYSDNASVCDFSATISCSLVNSSIYSELLNIPVAIMGVIWSLFLALFAWRALKDTDYYLALLGWSIAGIFSVLYLVWAEIALRSICPFCTVVHIIVIAVTIMSYILYSSLKKKPKWDKLKPKIGGSALFVLGIIIVLFLLFNIKFASGYDLDSFSNCVTDSGAFIYGSYKCGKCANQRALFEGYFEENIVEIECHPDGENSQTDLCLEKEISGTPTWVIEVDGLEIDRHPGMMDLESISEFTGCELNWLKD